MNKLFLFILLGLATAVSQAVLVDDFEDGNMDEYTQTVVLDQGGAPGAIHVVAAGGKVWSVIDSYDGIEQAVCLRDDVSLGVGEILLIDTSGFVDGSQDIGLVAAAATAQTPGLRQDYISLYMRSTTQVYSRGFNGTTEFGLAGGSTGGSIVEALFIERVDTHTFATGWISGTTAVITAVRTVNNSAIGTAIGIYSDMRAAGSIGGLDNLEIISLPAPPSITRHPADLTLSETGSAAFETVFNSQTPPAVTWYKTASPADLALDPAQTAIRVETTYDAPSEHYTSTLILSDLTIADGGHYYCRVTNDTGSQNSDAANLVVYGLVAHWTLDQSRYAGGAYLEEIDGFHAAVTGTPVFVTGADGAVNGAVQITPDAGWALCPALDPVRQSGQMTVSFYANWNAAEPAQQDLTTESADGESLTLPNGLKADGRWQHICTVFDGTAGKLYVDGVLRDQCDWQLPADTRAAVHIGVNRDGLYPFNGSIDDVRLYNYAFTDYDVAQLRYGFSGERSCILAFDGRYDLAGAQSEPDCTVDLLDLAVVADEWLMNYSLPEFSDLSAVWQSSGLYPEEQ